MTNTPLPPAARTPLWTHVTEGARASELRLQVCTACGQVQYPPREVCGRCLSHALEWRTLSGGGRVLSHTRLEASIEPWFQARLPVHVVSVELDDGPVVYALAEENMARTGTRVVIEARIDAADVAVFHATADNKGAD